MSYEVHWHEGLFLLPHHLQSMQASLHREIEQVRRSSTPLGCGLVELEVLSEHLGSDLLKISKLRAVMPNGLEISYPGNALIGSFNLAQKGVNRGGVLTVYLGVPLWQESRANTLKPDAVGAKVRYVTEEFQLYDENTGKNPKTVLFKKINACLLLEDSDRSDFEVIPILRLVPTASESGGRFRIDPKYSGVCRSIHASAELLGLIRGVTVNVENALLELRSLIGPRLATDIYSFETITKAMRLQALARAAPRLRSMISTAGLSPYQWYLELVGLHGDLGALHSDSTLSEVPDFNAEESISIFEDIVSKIRKLLSAGISANHQKVSFVVKGSSHFADLSSVNFDQVSDWFLLVKTNADIKAVANFVCSPSEFKLTVVKEINLALSGVELTLENSPPSFAVAPGGILFRLSRKWAKWQVAKSDRALAARWVHTTQPGEMTLSLIAVLASK